LYTVARGDTLRKIAKKFNVSTTALKEANNLSGAKVAVGEKLRIPIRETRATANTASSPIRTMQVESRPAQVETQPTPIEQQAPTPMATPAPAPEPQPRTPPSPELANMTF
jgi:LysM repeat protein